MHKRLLIGLAGAGIVGGGTFAFAASLGVTSDDLGAGNVVVASCDTTVDVDYTAAWNGGTPGLYEVDDVVVSGIDAACAGDDIAVSLVDSTGAQIGEATSTSVTAGSMTFDFTGEDTSAAAVTGVHVVISGQ